MSHVSVRGSNSLAWTCGKAEPHGSGNMWQSIMGMNSNGRGCRTHAEHEQRHRKAPRTRHNHKRPILRLYAPPGQEDPDPKVPINPTKWRYQLRAKHSTHKSAGDIAYCKHTEFIKTVAMTATRVEISLPIQ